MKGLLLAETPESNLNFIVDFRFSEIDAEIYVILDHIRAVERQLPSIAKTERSRLEDELEDVDPEEWHGQQQWIDEFVEEVLPRLYRAPILVQLWALFESAIIEISDYLRVKGGHSLTVDDLRGGSDYERAQKYYEMVLHFRMIEVEWVKEYLDMLLIIRNAIAHGNARVKAIKPARLQKMERWEKERGEILIGTDYVSFTSEFVGGMAQAVTVALNDLMNRVKEKY